MGGEPKGRGEEEGSRGGGGRFRREDKKSKGKKNWRGETERRGGGY